jgi:DnaJ-domain-containing protein 1
MGIKDRLKFIARSYMNSARRKGHELFDQAGLSSLEDENNDMTLEEQVRLAVEADLRREDQESRDRKHQSSTHSKFNRESKKSSNDNEHSKAGNSTDQSKQRKIAQHYANLELPPGAPIEEVHKAWRKLILKYHPDRHAGDKARIERATRISQIINSSYTALLEHLEVK